MAGRHGSVVVDERDVKVTSVFTKAHNHAVIDEDATLDDKTLGALGYKQEFKRYEPGLRLETGRDTDEFIVISRSSSPSQCLSLCLGFYLP